MSHVPPGRSENEMLWRMLRAPRVAIVGLSDDPSRPSFGVARYLLSAGKEVAPVNPNCASILGRRSFGSLSEVAGRFDIVNVFRRAEFCPEVVRQAIRSGTSGVWLQSGIVSAESRNIAADAGIDFVQDRCIKVELMLSAGPFAT